MNIDELTIGQAKELAGMVGGKGDNPGPWKVGQAYLIRTCTMTLTGRLVGVWPGELLLEEAAWIADTGRFSEALEGGVDCLGEVEPMGQAIVGRGAVVDATPWLHALAGERK